MALTRRGVVVVVTGVAVAVLAWLLGKLPETGATPSAAALGVVAVAALVVALRPATVEIHRSPRPGRVRVGDGCEIQLTVTNRAGSSSPVITHWPITSPGSATHARRRPDRRGPFVDGSLLVAHVAPGRAAGRAAHHLHRGRVRRRRAPHRGGRDRSGDGAAPHVGARPARHRRSARSPSTAPAP